MEASADFEGVGAAGRFQIASRLDSNVSLDAQMENEVVGSVGVEALADFEGVGCGGAFPDRLNARLQHRSRRPNGERCRWVCWSRGFSRFRRACDVAERFQIA